MNTDDTFDLLCKVAAYDQRTIGDGDVHAWSEALADVTLPEALEAVAAFEVSEQARQRRIIPADVVQWVAWKRRAPRENEWTQGLVSESRAQKDALYGAHDEPRPALPPGGLVGSDPSGGRRAESPALRALWESAVQVPCRYPRCARPLGERCVNPHNGITTKIPHNCRTRDSGHF